MTNEQKAAEIRKCFSCRACKVFAKDEYALNTPCDTFCEIMQAMEWKEEQIFDLLRSEVLSAHMHGGEIDEVLAELDEKMKGE